MLLFGRKILVSAAVLALITPVLAVGVIYSAYALSAPPVTLVDVDFDINSAKGFQRAGLRDGAPDLFLERGKTGTINLVFISYENETVYVRSAWYGGEPPYNKDIGGRSLPNGITYSIEPQNIAIAPVQKCTNIYCPPTNTTITLRISAAPSTEIRTYDLSFAYILNATKKVVDFLEGGGANSHLTIVESTSPTTTITTTRSTTLYINRTVTSTLTQTSTTTVPSTLISTSTTTLSTVLTSTTTTTLTQETTEPSTYAWAVGATATAIALAAVLTIRKRKV